MLQNVYIYLLEVLLQNLSAQPPTSTLAEYDNICEKMKCLCDAPESLRHRMQEQHIDSVSIYGVGSMGKSLFYLLQKCNVKISALLDQKNFVFHGMQTVSPENYMMKNIRKIIGEKASVMFLGDLLP